MKAEHDWGRDLEQEIQACLPQNPEVKDFHTMMRYPFGWVDERLQPASAPAGKRLRPTLCLLCCQAAGGDYHTALPAAAAVEIIHNFSLVHDDVQDRSVERRHRPSVYALWGDAQAINLGDAMFTQGRRALLRLIDRGVPAVTVLAAVDALDATCLALTEGQYLDMDFESRTQVSEEEYYSMIRRKTGALLACSAQLGPLVATGDAGLADGYHRFGLELGVAFQVQDDILGIWGDPNVTGKPAADDILSRKKTLPVLFARRSAMESDRELLKAYYKPYASQQPPSVREVIVAMERAGAREYAEETARRWCQQALATLESVQPAEPAASTLRSLVTSLLGREK